MCGFMFLPATGGVMQKERNMLDCVYLWFREQPDTIQKVGKPRMS